MSYCVVLCMLCCVVLCCDMLRGIVLCCALCCVALCYVVLCSNMSIQPCCVVPCFAIVLCTPIPKSCVTSSSEHDVVHNNIVCRSKLASML